jgi:tRNA-dihydrouridine synthase B
VTAKIRSGWNSDNAVEIARLIESAGASGITVHWRNAREGRERKDEWSSVGEVKQALGIPVVGNGGASSPELAVRFLRETGCDAVMISSGALGNPRIFARANALLDGKEAEADCWEARLADFREYFGLAEKYGLISPKRLRVQAQEYLTGQPGVKIARKKINEAKAVENIAEIMKNFKPS